MTRHRLLFAGLLATSLSWGGDPMKPQLVDGSGFKSAELRYEVIGTSEEQGSVHVWVLTEPAIVTSQHKANEIIEDIRRRLSGPQGAPAFSEIWFFSGAGSDPQHPTFEVGEHLGTYILKKNRVYFGPGAGELSGGSAHGPQGSDPH